MKTTEFVYSGYNEANGGPLADEVRLDCAFESSCCYTNAQAPEDQLDWELGSGDPDIRAMVAHFGTKNFPCIKD